MGSWCGPGVPEAVWVGVTSVAEGLVVVGQAPPEVASIDVASEDGSTNLTVEETDQGRFFVGVDVLPGDYEVTAERQDGSKYVSEDVSMGGGGTTMLTITP